MIYANWEGKVHVGGCEMTAHVMDKHLFFITNQGGIRDWSDWDIYTGGELVGPVGSVQCAIGG